ncbi:MAG TPA: HepT-like ribonuclease domain-containing protein [Blastocatellia bacterium]|nr:HepT-like ribonuclease domain-containing protein [Blastocatellia bacterium]
MNPVDKVKIGELFVEFRKAREILEELKETTVEKVVSHFEKHGAAKYFLIVAVEAAIDIYSHVTSAARPAKGLRRHLSHHGRRGNFPDELVRELEKVAKLRNLLVHLYGRLDDRKVYDILQTWLDDLDRFESCVQRYLGMVPYKVC